MNMIAVAILMLVAFPWIIFLLGPALIILIAPIILINGFFCIERKSRKKQLKKDIITFGNKMLKIKKFNNVDKTSLLTLPTTLFKYQ